MRKKNETVPIGSRYDRAPHSFNSKEVEFLERGKQAKDCINCDDGCVECERCQGEERVDCETCSGNGELRHDCGRCSSGTVDCPECGGSGNIKIEGQCPRCTDGSGTIGCPDCVGDNPECRECGGDGVIDCPECEGNGIVKVDSERCDECDGDGGLECPKCGGTESYTENCSDCRYDGTVTCPECSGTGGDTCSICEGDGEVVEAVHGKVRFVLNKKKHCPTDGIPPEHLMTSDGELVAEDHQIEGNDLSAMDENGDIPGTYRQKKEVYDVPPCTSVRYRYDGKEYTVTYVEADGGKIRYTDSPRSLDFVNELLEESRGEGKFRAKTDALNKYTGPVFDLLLPVSVFVGAIIGAVVLSIALAFIVLPLDFILGLFGFGISSLQSDTILILLIFGILLIPAFIFAFETRKKEQGGYKPKGDVEHRRSHYTAAVVFSVLIGVLAYIEFLSGYQTLVASGIAVSMWGKASAHAATKWVLDLEAGREGRKEFVEKADIDQDFIKKHGMESKLPKKKGIFSDELYNYMSIFVLFLGCFCAAAWTGLYVFHTYLGRWGFDVSGGVFDIYPASTVLLAGLGVAASISALLSIIVLVDRYR